MSCGTRTRRITLFLFPGTGSHSGGARVAPMPSGLTVSPEKPRWAVLALSLVCSLSVVFFSAIMCLPVFRFILLLCNFRSEVLGSVVLSFSFLTQVFKCPSEPQPS